MSGWGVSNSRPPAPRAGALTPAPHPGCLRWVGFVAFPCSHFRSLSQRSVVDVWWRPDAIQLHQSTAGFIQLVRYCVPPDGIEPPTSWFVARHSNPLSYGGVVLSRGIEPRTSELSALRSDRLSYDSAEETGFEPATGFARNRISSSAPWTRLGYSSRGVPGSAAPGTAPDDYPTRRSGSIRLRACSRASYRIRTGVLRLDGAASTPNWTDEAWMVATGVEPVLPVPAPK
jgi:hypothetical protein